MKLSAYDIEHIPLGELLAEAERLRRATFEDNVDLCAIVNIKSGRCAMDCRFCAQSAYYSTDVGVYSLRGAADLVSSTLEIWNDGVRRVGWVASGCRLSTSDLDQVLIAAEELSLQKFRHQKCSLCCASFGQLDSESLIRLQAAGFKHYHHNLETSERFYPSICTTQRWRDRLATIQRVLELGWEICSGGLFGLGETWEDRIQLAKTLNELKVKSVPLNFYNAINGTPFAGLKPLSVEEGLRIIALFRIMLPDASLKICGGRPKIFAEQGEKLFHAGADALMTGNYLTTNGINPEQDKKMITNAGLLYNETTKKY
ncbi:MAG: biotin synthase BioB [Planctomycetaceae bacterium]|jgi:biotin synthase|nr:biotin synthase BioB [Planctomycetaceae bacterium]